MSLNIGFITWIIKKDDFRKFHNSKISTYMLSEEVTTQNMKWYLKCYPNGSKHKFEGWCGLSLNLKQSSIPDNINTVLVRYYLYETQSSSVSRGIARFNNHPTEKGVVISAKALAAAAPSYAKSNGTNYLVETDTLKKFDIIILKCEFEIIRIYKLGKIIYGYPLKLNKIISYEWNIVNKYLDKFKATDNPYTRLYSQEFNVWSLVFFSLYTPYFCILCLLHTLIIAGLVLVPSATTYNSKGNISLRLRLYELPPIISSIKIVVVLSCKQFNKSWTSICNLSYSEPWISWPPTTLKKISVDEKLFDEVTNNKADALKSVCFECKIEILSITLFKFNNIHNLEIRDCDSKYKNVWNKFILDDNNIFMKKSEKEKNQNAADQKEESDETQQQQSQYGDEYDLTLTDFEEDDDEYLICKKEDFIRMNILKSLDLTDQKQKEYLMNSVHFMNESMRVLRKESHSNKVMLKQLQTMMHSMQKNMKTMKAEIESVSKTKQKENENENFIKRLKKDKAKREKMKEKEVGKEEKKKSKKKRKKEEKKKENKVMAEEVATFTKGSNDVSSVTTKVKRTLSAKQQLFKTWMDMVVHLPQYFELFVDAGYEDLTYIENMQLGEQDLIQIGIDKKGHRQKILQEIKKMKPKKKVIVSDNINMNEMNAESMIPSMNGLDDNLGFTSINKTEINGMDEDLHFNVEDQEDAHNTGW